MQDLGRQRGPRRRAWVFALAVLGVAGCSSGGSSDGEGFAPDDSQITVNATNQSGESVQVRYVYGRANPVVLGTVRDREQARWTFRHSRNGDLRLTGEFNQRRTATCNALQLLQPGESLNLLINQRKELELSRASPNQ